MGKFSGADTVKLLEEVKKPSADRKFLREIVLMPEILLWTGQGDLVSPGQIGRF